MDGGMPDPSTLDTEEDDNVTLNVVQEKAKMERTASLSQRAPSTSSQPARPTQPPPSIDLFGDDPAPMRPSTTEPPARQPPPKVAPAVPKQSNQGLLGLDFFGGPTSAPPPRASSATPTGSGSVAAAPGRVDLKQSILSLYSSTPKPPPQPTQSQQTQQTGGAFGALQSPPLQSPQQSSFGGLNDAFSSLSFSSAPAQQPQAAKPSPFANLTSPKATPAPPAQTNTWGSGGGFFNTTSRPTPKPANPPVQTQAQPPPPAAQRSFSSSSGFGDFFSNTPATPAGSQQPQASSMGGTDLFGLMDSPAPAPKQQPAPSTSVNSAFNLSSPVASSQPAASKAQPQTSNAFSGLGNMSTADPWGSSDVWATSSSAQTPAATTSTTNEFGWGSSNNGLSGSGGFVQIKSTPQVQQDEEFGGWSSAAPTTPAASNTQSKPASGFSGGDDLFSNVWQ